MRYPVILLLLLSILGCESKNKPGTLVERPISTPQPAPSSAATPAALPKLPPPTTAEVQAACARVFGDVLVIDRTRRQILIVGDFNGDGSQDLAVIVRPARGKLAEINSELANWTIQDADKAFVPTPGQRVVRMEKPAAAKMMEGESVLAIIHGYGAQGWRDPAARQAYLVKHAAATFQGTAPSISQKAIRDMHLPVETEIIQEVRGRKKGFLFWTGGLYAWHASES
jgi:hypothetical protein